MFGIIGLLLDSFHINLCSARVLRLMMDRAKFNRLNSTTIIKLNHNEIPVDAPANSCEFESRPIEDGH